MTWPTYCSRYCCTNELAELTVKFRLAIASRMRSTQVRDLWPLCTPCSISCGSKAVTKGPQQPVSASWSQSSGTNLGAATHSVDRLRSN
jgi:hypothetical protein